MPRPFTRGRAGLYVPSGGVWTPPQSGSLALWSQYDGDGSDSSGNNRTFTLYNGATYATDPDGADTVLHLPGSNDNVTAGAYSGMTGGTSSTYCAWIRPTTYGTTEWGRILCQRNGISSIDCYLNDNSATRSLTAAYYTNGTTPTLVAPSNSIVLGVWTHVAFTVESGSQKLYLDGSEVNSGAAVYSALNGSGTQSLLVGNRGDFSREFNGYISDVMVWYNKVLTPAEIVDVYTNVRSV